MVTPQQAVSNYHRLHLGTAAVESYSVWLESNAVDVGRSQTLVLIVLFGHTSCLGGSGHIALVM